MAAITQPTTSNVSARPLLAAAQFREIHKNSWLKRLNADGKKITVGPKKSDRSWVVFCVHDDTEAILEGYAEPRQAASHNPEWIVLLQSTLHVSHALIPNSNEFEFVVTLSNEVIRFHAMSWEIMQEWVDTLRSKLREMKIISPRENLYTKLPEIRAPLLPTRDPTSPLPLPPPVPAAIVPGVEIVVPQSAQQQVAASNNGSQLPTTASGNSNETQATNITAMSNTSTQNLLNMLADPITSYSEQIAQPSSSSSSNVRLNNAEQLSTSLNDLRLHQNSIHEDEDCLSPLLRPTGGAAACSAASVRKKRNSADQPKNDDDKIKLQCDDRDDRLIPRSQTSRSQSAGAADKTKNAKTPNVHQIPNCNRMALAIAGTSSSASNNEEAEAANDFEENNQTNITIIQVSSSSTKEDQAVPKLPSKSSVANTAEIFKFPEIKMPSLSNDDVTINATPSSATTTTTKHVDYKTNVQLIPSSGNAKSSTIKILGESSATSTSASASSSALAPVTLSSTNFAAAAVANQYSTPVKKKIPLPAQQNKSLAAKLENNQTITTVHVGGGSETAATTTTTTTSIYGTCFTVPPPPPIPSTTTSSITNGQVTTVSTTSTPAKMPKKIILSANTSGITNICVDSNSCHQKNEQLTTSQSVAASTASTSQLRCNAGNVHYEKVFLSSSTPIMTEFKTTSNCTVVTTATATASSTTTPTTAPKIPTTKTVAVNAHLEIDTVPLATPPSSSNHHQQQQQQKEPPTSIERINKAVQTTTTTTDISSTKNANLLLRSPLVQRRAMAALRSANMLTRGLTEAVISTRPRSRRDLFASGANNATKLQQQQQHRPTHSAAAGAAKKSSSIVNNNENGDNSANLLEQQQRRRSSSTSDATTSTPPQRPQQQRGNGVNNNSELTPNPGRLNFLVPLRFQQPPSSFVGGAVGRSPPLLAGASSKRLTLREQQVMQLRREIMHPGGVRLQLRRKDCIGSIAWVEAFGAVWVAGWKQKEHPVLYNALHIGDQLLSIAGVVISSAAEANKVIRNTNTLFVELLIRRMPFGCGIAIRRDREGQCLGLIRDGNTATIVDVVPNSLAARHGLPPKAQACDGSTLTFWVLTEINGRPLNLFFKDNEIRDRLNAVGRDISILVQPSDLITKLKKQLKSLRGYKDYLVQ